MLDYLAPIPRETIQAIRENFNGRGFYLLVGERLGSILTGIRLEYLSDANGGLTERASLPMITFFQFIEGLTDQQTIEALQTRADWKFALHLPVNPPVLRERMLCGFRQKIIMDAASQHEYQKLIDCLLAFNPPFAVSRQSFKAFAVIDAVCFVNRLNWMTQMMCEALQVLAIKFPGWLRRITLPHWYVRYNRSVSGLISASLLRRLRFSIAELGADIQHLLEEVNQSDPGGISDLQEIKILRHIWQQNFENSAEAAENNWSSAVFRNCERCSYGAFYS